MQASKWQACVQLSHTNFSKISNLNVLQLQMLSFIIPFTGAI